MICIGTFWCRLQKWQSLPKKILCVADRSRTVKQETRSRNDVSVICDDVLQKALAVPNAVCLFLQDVYVQSACICQYYSSSSAQSSLLVQTLLLSFKLLFSFSSNRNLHFFYSLNIIIKFQQAS